jgi:hypothetical protein
MSSNRFARLALAALAVATLAVGISTAPASAVVVDTDDVRVATTDADFGDDPVVAGTPDFGAASWDVAGGNTTPTVTGKLYIAAVGACYRIRLETYDLTVSHTNPVTAKNSQDHCATTGGRNWWSVNLTATGDPAITHLHVILQRLVAGSYTDQAYDWADLGGV